MMKTVAIGLAMCAWGVPAYADPPTNWGILGQVTIGSSPEITRSFSTDGSSPPYPVAGKVKATSGGVSTFASTSLPLGRMEVTVTGYAPNASAYASYQDILEVTNLNAPAGNYVDVKVEVPGTANISPEAGNVGAGITLMVSSCVENGGGIVAEANSKFYSSGNVSEAELGTWSKLGAGPNRTFETRIATPPDQSTCGVEVYYIMSCSSSNNEYPDASCSLKFNTYFGIPSGTSWSSASGALLTAATGHVTFHDE